MTSSGEQQSMWSIDCHFPGGNIVLEQIAGDEVWLRQDLRDDNDNWFFWAFRVKNAGGRQIHFHFTSGDVIGARGPCISRDGIKWQWLGNESVERKEQAPPTFSHDFGPEENQLFIAFCPLYTQQQFDRFLHTQAPHWLTVDRLCLSRKGQPVELLCFGNPNASIEFIGTARHHACESMGSYCLEGFLDAALAEDELGRWLRDNIHFALVPFMDKDGVEAGDQGKNRRPYDHNRDYGGNIVDSIYPEVRALRERLEKPVSPPKARILIDFHCPWIRGKHNEAVYFVGHPDNKIWQRVTHFSTLLQELQRGPLRYSSTDNLPFGIDWNILDSDKIGARSCANWGASIPAIHFAASLEVPYANANGAEVTPEACRELGRDIAHTLQLYTSDL